MQDPFKKTFIDSQIYKIRYYQKSAIKAFRTDLLALMDYPDV